MLEGVVIRNNMCCIYIAFFLAFSFDIYLEVRQWYTDIHKLAFTTYKIVMDIIKNFIGPSQEALNDHG